MQKQPPSGVPKKKCSENMQQIYRRTPMQKCELNKVALATSAWVFSCKFAAYFQKNLLLRRPLESCFWKCYDHFSSFIKFISIKEILKIGCYIYIYWGKWLFWRKNKWQWRHSLHLFSIISVWPLTDKSVCKSEPVRKKPSIFTLQLPVYIKYSNRKSQLMQILTLQKRSETSCLCCTQLDAMLNASAKIPEDEGSISSSSFDGQQLNY